MSGRVGLLGLGDGFMSPSTGGPFDPFAIEGQRPPWYSFVIGLSAFAFALGALCVGLAALRLRTDRRAAATALVLGGILYVLAIPLAAAGHLLWALPWLVLGALLISGVAPRHSTDRPRQASSPGSRR